MFLFSGLLQSTETVMYGPYPAAHWQDAVETCNATGRRLLTVPTQAKEDAIAPYIPDIE